MKRKAKIGNRCKNGTLSAITCTLPVSMVDDAAHCLRSMRASCESVDAAREHRRHARRIVVDDHALDRIDRGAPWRGSEHPLRVHVTGLPACADARRREVDVFGVI